MRKLKKALSLTLALALSLAMAVPAFAAPVTVGESYNFARTTFSDVVSQETVKGSLWSMDGDRNAIPLITVKVGTTLTVENNGTFAYTGRDFREAYVKDDGSYGYNYNEKKFNTGVADGTPYTLTEENIGLWYFTGGDAGKDYYLNVIAGDGSTTTPVEPEQPTEPTTPVEPEKPTEPTTPVEPEQPTEPADPSTVTTVEVAASNNQRLNVRTGPGTNYKIAAPALKNGTVLQISEIQGQWGKLADGKGWVYLPGTKTISEPTAPVEPETPAEPAGPELAEGEVAYTIKSGDTLSKIAKDVYGNMADYKRIVERNPDIIKDANKIYAGQVIVLPAKG